MLAHLRQACRSIQRTPALSAVIIVSVAAGIGINTVAFSWIQARVLEPVPAAPDSDEVLLIEPKSAAGLYVGSSWAEFTDLREQLGAFQHLFAGRMAPLYIGEPGRVERLFGLLVSENYFSGLGVQPVTGRLFSRDEYERGERVAVISHRIWSARFAASPDILAQTLRINGQTFGITGVAPAAFQGTTPGLQVDAWIPAPAGAALTPGSREMDGRDMRGYGVMGRLRPGMTAGAAQTELDTVMRKLSVSHPSTNAHVTAEILPFYMSPRGPQRMLNLALGVLQGIMLLLLAAICGNVSNLLLARAAARQKDIGIRLSLGASPRSIAGLLLTESVLLALAGAGLGAVFAAWGTKALLILPMTGVPLRFETGLDLTSLTFAMALALCAGLLFGLIPALHLSRLDPHQVFRTGLGEGSRSGLRQGLMAAQVALAMVVLIVAGMFMHAFLETRGTDPGFRRDVMLMAYDVSGRNVDAAFSRDLTSRTLGRLRSMPSVEAAAIATSVPLDIHGLPARRFSVEGHARADGAEDEALTNTVSPGYFDVMGIPVVRGSDFVALSDGSAPPQAIVNEEFVRRYLAAGESIGRRIRSRNRTYVIAGVVGNSLYNAFGEAPTPIVYLSYRDAPVARGEIHVRAARGAGPVVATEVARAMREIDAELPVFNTRSMHEHVDTNLIFRRIPARMFAVLGPMLLLLAGIGIYAVVSHSVSRRTREIGVRLAVGGTAKRVVWTLVGESLAVAVAGGVLGWSAAFLLTAALLPAARLSAVVFVAVPGVLLTVAVLASWLPARRAAAVDPAITLRAE